MNERFDLKNARQERQLFLSRSTVLIVFVIALLLGLFYRLTFLQVETYDKYASLAQGNRVKLSALTPIRGLIYDRNGQVLAENNPSYSLELIPEQINDLTLTIEALSKILPISEKDIKKFHKKRKQNKRFSSIPIRSRLNSTEVASFAVKRHLFPGVEIQARPLRHYPYPELTSHLVGYVGAINERELKKIDPVNYRASRHIGKTGLEKTYETELHGSVGYQQTENTAQGRSIKVLRNSPPLSGTDLHLHIDIQLQQVAYDAFGDRTGSIIAVDTQTGAIRALISKPGFNSNLFVRGIDQASYSELQNSTKRPLFNRALRGQYPPGSTLKPFMGLAGLESNVISSSQKIFCPGYYQLPKQTHKYRDWKKNGHGSMNVHDSIVQSCDVYFYILAHQLKIDRIHDFLSKFGFGKKTGLDIIGEKSGLLPSTAWKKRAKNQVWYPGETLISGIGQGFNLTTPLQLAHATAVLANKGYAFKPSVVARLNDKIIKPVTSENTSIILSTPQHWNTIINAMHDVVEGARGTAKRIKTDAFTIAGKTGTAQVFTVKQDEKYDEENVAEHLKDHALFISFAPAEKPQLAIAVIVENGGHGGSVAAPIARAIFDHYIKTTPTE